jgi:hypothetical protein
VETALEGAAEHLVHESVTLDPALALEGVRYDIKSEVRLAALAPARMTLMLVRLVRDNEVRRLQGILQGLRDPIREGWPRGHRRNLF